MVLWDDFAAHSCFTLLVLLVIMACEDHFATVLLTWISFRLVFQVVVVTTKMGLCASTKSRKVGCCFCC